MDRSERRTRGAVGLARDRDLAIVVEVLGEIHGGYPARAELTLDAVAVGERGRQARHSVGQSGSES